MRHFKPVTSSTPTSQSIAPQTVGPGGHRDPDTGTYGTSGNKATRIMNTLTILVVMG
jgi:hypothetical protein